jgi:hypothetical protein
MKAAQDKIDKFKLFGSLNNKFKDQLKKRQFNRFQYQAPQVKKGNYNRFTFQDISEVHLKVGFYIPPTPQRIKTMYCNTTISTRPWNWLLKNYTLGIN